MKSWKKKNVCVCVCHIYVCMYILYIYIYIYIYMTFLVSSRGTRVGMPQGRSLSQALQTLRPKYAEDSCHWSQKQKMVVLAEMVKEGIMEKLKFEV